MAHESQNSVNVSLVFDRHNVIEVQETLANATDVVVAGVVVDGALPEILQTVKDGFDKNGNLRVRLRPCNAVPAGTAPLDAVSAGVERADR